MKRHILAIAFLSMLLCASSLLTAQVAITKAGGGLLICTNTAPGGIAPGPTTLDTLRITETTNSDFANGNDTLILKPPTGWKFWAGVTTGIAYFPYGGGDISADDLLWSGDSIVLHIGTSGITKRDTQLIYGIQVQPMSDTAAPGYVYAFYVKGISGIAAGPTGTNFGDLSLSPSKIAGSPLMCITGYDTLSDASSSGAWSSTNTAVATVGALTGIVGGVSGGTDTIVYTLPSTCAVHKTIYVNPCTEATPYIPHNDDAVDIYPNPADDNFSIRMTTGAYQHYTIKNLLGQMLVHEPLLGTETSVDIRDMRPGLYLISFSGSAGNVTLRFIKR